MPAEEGGAGGRSASVYQWPLDASLTLVYRSCNTFGAMVVLRKFGSTMFLRLTLALTLGAPASAADFSGLENFISPTEMGVDSSNAFVSVELGPSEPQDDGFKWEGAIRQAAAGIAFQHAFRIALQDKTRRELGGSFFGDYWRSIRGVKGWRDDDAFYINYIGHPMMGAAAGYIQVQNDPRYRDVEFGATREYFVSRLRAFGFAALYSTLFEIGPFSEASVGNVGLNSGTSGLVDFVVTPIGGVGFMVLEDALDKHVIEPFERRNSSRTWRGVVRILLNPTRSVATLLQKKPPWRRARAKLTAPY